MYKEPRLTNKHSKDLLVRLLGEVGSVCQQRPDLILAAWPGLVGPRFANMTRAVLFEQGLLHVKVSNSTLYSVLAQQERGRLLKSLRQQFPSVEIKNICFRMG